MQIKGKEMTRMYGVEDVAGAVIVPKARDYRSHLNTLLIKDTKIFI